MSGLALIVSNDHSDLEQIALSLAGIGFATNCVDSARVAEQLVSTYGQDYDAVIIDVSSITRPHEDIFGALRAKNPQTRVFATSKDAPTFWVSDDKVVVCQHSEVVTHLRT